MLVVRLIHRHNRSEPPASESDASILNEYVHGGPPVHQTPERLPFFL